MGGKGKGDQASPAKRPRSGEPNDADLLDYPEQQPGADGGMDIEEDKGAEAEECEEDNEDEERAERRAAEAAAAPAAPNAPAAAEEAPPQEDA